MSDIVVAPSPSTRNPFRRSRTRDVFSYTVDGQSRRIESDALRNYRATFQKIGLDEQYVAENTAVDLLELSRLSEDELGDIWDYALAATYDLKTPVPLREDCLVRERFYILLAELQRKLGMEDEVFCGQILGIEEFIQTSDYSQAKDTTSVDSKPVHVAGVASVRKDSKTAASQGQKDAIPNQVDMHQDQHKDKDAGELDIVMSGTQQINLYRSHAESRDSEQKELAMNLDEEKEVVKPHSTSSTAQEARYHDNSPGKYRAFEEKEVVKSPSHVRSEENSVGLASSQDGAIRHGEVQKSSSHERHNSIHELTDRVSTAESDKLARTMVMDLQVKAKKGYGLALKKREKTADGYLYTSLAKALRIAATDGNLPLVESLLELGADINYDSPKEESRHNTIMAAVEAKHYDIVDYLLRKGTDTISAGNALQKAIQMKAVDIAKRLVPYSQFTLPANRSPLARYLGLTITQKSSMGCAITMEHPDRLELLRIMINHPTFWSNDVVTIFHMRFDSPGTPEVFLATAMACLTMEADLEGIEIFLQRFGSQYKIPSVRDPSSREPLEEYINPLCCVPVGAWQKFPTKTMELVKLLMSHGADVSSPNKGPPCSPLVAAIAARSLQAVKFLLDHGASPEGKMQNSFTNLYYKREDLPSPGSSLRPPYSMLGFAAYIGEVGICRALIEKGAIPWLADSNGETPLLHAYRGGRNETAQYLLSVDKGRSNLYDCLNFSIKNNNLDMVEAVINAGAGMDRTTLVRAMVCAMEQDVKRGIQPTNVAIIDMLLATGCPINQEMVLTAIDSGNLAGLSRLLQRRGSNLGFDKQAVFANKRWTRTLMSPRSPEWQNCMAYAKKCKAKEFMKLLRDYGFKS